MEAILQRGRWPPAPAITMDVKPTASPSSSQQRLTAFVARLPQLTDDLTVQ
jgi:hypothetical protein